MNLAGYELDEKIGSGGMGAVFRATDRRIGRVVAIKMIRPDRVPDELSRERFVREAKSIGRLNHANIAILYDVSLEGETPYLVMEYLPGGSLERRLTNGPMQLGAILRYAIGMAAGLSHAHSSGVVHRDLKPGNILFSSEDVPKIIDFGLATSRDTGTLTQPGTVTGTAEYMAPEQARGEGADQRSDLFSFGVILYQMATGRHPFRSDSIPATLHKIVYDPPEPLEKARPDLPPAFTKLVGALLEKEPDRRPQNLRKVIDTLHAIEVSSSTGLGATETMLIAPVLRGSRRLSWIWLAAILMVAAIGATWWALSRKSALPASQQLVVLPFDNLSHDPLEQAFCDGLVELVTSTLTQVERFHNTLWVIPSADVRRLQLHSVADARKAFPVNLAVTGSLQIDGEQVLVIVNLSDSATGRQIGSRLIPASRIDRSQLSTRLTSAVLDLLDLSTAGPTGDVLRGAQPKTASAYDTYLKSSGLLQHAEVPANLDHAIDLLEQSVKLDDTFAPSNALLADAYLRRYTRTKEKEWLAKADQVAQRALQLDPGRAVVRHTLGRLYRATGQTDRAIEEFQKEIALDPLNVAAYTSLALAYRDARRPADAEAAYLQAMRIRPGYSPAYSNLGVFYTARGEYAKALEPLTLAVKLSPDSADDHTTLGNLYYYMERWDEASAEFGKSISLRPSATAYSNRGGVRFYLGDYAGSAADFRQATQLEPNNALTWGNLGDALDATGDSGARDAYLRAIELSRQQLAVNAKDADLLGRMSFYLAKTSECREALTRIDEARRLAPDRVPLLFKSAKVAEVCHQRDSAIRYLESAIRKGYPRREIEQDPNLEQLRRTPAYAAMRARTADLKK